jgi:hypothetical protein
MLTIKQRKDRIRPEEKVNWSVVEAILKEYKRRRPEELAGCFIYVKKLREDTKTDFAEVGTDSNMRYMYEIPNGLKMALEMKYPEVLKEGNLTKFLKKYPQFSIAKKV